MPKLSKVEDNTDAEGIQFPNGFLCEAHPNPNVHSAPQLSGVVEHYSSTSKGGNGSSFGFFVAFLP